MKRIVAMIFVAVMLTATVLSVCASSFRDVPDDAYYAAAAERMAKEGILSGFGDGRYYGSLSVTRAQIAALVCKMLGKTKEAEALAGKTAFKDIPVTSWCTGYVNYAVANGIIVGDGDGNFRPDDDVKFEEVIKVIVCILGLDDGIKIDPADWSKEYIAVAENNGLIRNILSKKGEAMLRSDIAVVCDSAFTIMKHAAETSDEDVTTTTKKIHQGNKDDDDDVEVTVKKPETTTTETTTIATMPPFGNENYDEVEGTVNNPETTTASTTTSTTTSTTYPKDPDRLPDIWFD